MITHPLHAETEEITRLIVDAGEKARREVAAEPEPGLTQSVDWPIECTVGPGLEGAIACETDIGYVNGTKGWLIYRGYDIFDLCAYSTFEEVSYLLLHGALPTERQLNAFKRKLLRHRSLPKTIRLMAGFPIETMNSMAALRIGTNMMRQEFTYADSRDGRPRPDDAIAADEDSIPMETPPRGTRRAIYEFGPAPPLPAGTVDGEREPPTGLQSACHLISGVATLAAAVNRVRSNRLPIEPDPDLGHAGNLIYMMTGRHPTPVEERVMDVALILHADHGMNASTFAALVVASTLSDMYFAVGSGIAALNGPLHGGANERVMHLLQEIGSARNVPGWYAQARAEKRKIMGFGHRVYRAYDPRARVLAPLAEKLAQGDRRNRRLFGIARALEKQVVSTLGEKRGIFPNVDFYSGLVYSTLGVPNEMFTPLFAVSRVSGWTARILEYLKKNRIFRPRAMYTGPFDRAWVPIDRR